MAEEKKGVWAEMKTTKPEELQHGYNLSYQQDKENFAHFKDGYSLGYFYALHDLKMHHDHNSLAQELRKVLKEMGMR